MNRFVHLFNVTEPADVLLHCSISYRMAFIGKCSQINKLREQSIHFTFAMTSGWINSVALVQISEILATLLSKESIILHLLLIR